MTGPHHDLETIQRWMQAVITHPAGVAEGIETDEAQQQIEIAPEQIEEVVPRSKRQGSLERIEVYASAYFARLLECLRSEFPVLMQTIGEELFDEFVVGYLNTYPSRSYSLGHLGEKFPQYLEETCPRDDQQTTIWADFLIDLARLEWTFNEVFDGPGIERERLLDPEQIQAITPELWPQSRLIAAPCLRLMHFRYPVSRFYGAKRHEADTPIPRPEESYVAVSRRNYVVSRFELSRVQYELLTQICAKETIGDAIAHAAEFYEGDFDQLAADLNRWFQQWATQSLFLRIESPE